MRRIGFRRTQTVLTASLATVPALSATAACGSGGDEGPGGKVKVDINGQPPKAQAQERAIFDAGMKANPSR